MKIILLSILFFTSFNYAQTKKREFKGVELIEEFSSKEYSLPKSILFFSAGHWEIEKFYQILFKKLKKQLRKENCRTQYKYQLNDSIPSTVNSFSEIQFSDILEEETTVCVFALGTVQSNLTRIQKETGQSVFIDPQETMYFDFYMMLIDMTDREILLKRKFSVEANKVYYSNNRNLAKAITQELKM
jgi:hypothetical protein